MSNTNEKNPNAINPFSMNSGRPDKEEWIKLWTREPDLCNAIIKMEQSSDNSTKIEAEIGLMYVICSIKLINRDELFEFIKIKLKDKGIDSDFINRIKSEYSFLNVDRDECL